MDLNRMLKPSRVAIVGASEKENLGGFTVRMMMKYAKERMQEIYLVNPKRDEIFGIPCYHALGELPVDIDLVIIATDKTTVESILTEAAKKGAAGAVVYASGYGETGKPEDKAREESLKALCEKLDIALMGPNCAGFINVAGNMPAMGFLTTVPENAGKVGLISQSGMICTLLLDSGKADFSYIISCGNSKIVEVVDYIDFLVDDEDTSVIAAYIEGITNPAKFIATLKKAAVKRKPVILLKIGRSEAGRRSAVSHTGSLSGSDAAFDAIFKKYGVIRADDLEDLAGLGNLFATLKRYPDSNRVVSFNGSGGETGISGDVGYQYGVNFPAFSPETVQKLKTLLPDYASVNNPLDATATVCYDTDVFANIAEMVINDPNFDMAMVGITIVNELTDLCVKHMSEGLVKLVRENRVQKPVVVVPAVESGRMDQYVGMLKKAGIPVTSPCSYAYRHIKKLLDYCEWLKIADESIGFDIPLQGNRTSGERYTLGEHKAKRLFMEHGIPVPEEALAITPEEAAHAAEKMGYPVVLKIESDDIPHKSDIGGVKLSITDEDGVRSAFEEILQNARGKCPDAKINGVLVQKMLSGGLEVIVGVNRDPQLGHMVLFGLGGVNVDLFRDVAVFPAPFGRETAKKMINSLKSSRLFHGYRGKPELDVEALADTLSAVSKMAVANEGRIVELDINPLFVFPKGQGVIAADGVVVLEK